MTTSTLNSSLAIESSTFHQISNSFACSSRLVIGTFGHAEEDTQAFDIFMTILGAAGAASSASTPLSAGISGMSSFLTLMDQLSSSDEANDRLMAEGVLGMVQNPHARFL